MKSLEVIFIRIKVKGYLKNNTENDSLEFEEKGIKIKNKISYLNNNIKNTIKINDNGVILIRENDEFLNTFVFNNKKSTTNYLLKENNYSFDLDVITTHIDVSDNIINIKYKIVETNCEYEFKIEMSEIL